MKKLLYCCFLIVFSPSFINLINPLFSSSPGLSSLNADEPLATHPEPSSSSEELPGIEISGVLTLDPTSATTISGCVSGPGGLTKSGSGTVTISADSCYTGETNISAGELVVKGSINATSKASVANGASLIFDPIESNAFSKEISGEGAVIKIGKGTTTLSGANTYTGATIVSEGKLAIDLDGRIDSSKSITVNKGASISVKNDAVLNNLSGDGDVSLSNGIGFTQTNSSDTAFSGTISGTNGSITKNGTGNLTLSGAHTYTGATTVLEGTLSVTGPIDTTSGASIAGGATLNFNPSAPSTFTKVISGKGAVTKTGDQTKTLSAISTYTGNTTVSEGTLIVTGSIAASKALKVTTGAVLKGNGIIPSVLVRGVMQPGTSIGTIVVAGDYTQSSASTLNIEINPSSTSLVDVSGSATIEANTTLHIIPQDGSYSAGSTFIFLDADGGLTGTFDNLTVSNSNLGNLTPSLQYSDNQAQILLSASLEEGLSSPCASLPALPGSDTSLLKVNSDLVVRISRSQMSLITEIQNQRFVQEQACFLRTCDLKEKAAKKNKGVEKYKSLDKKQKKEKKCCEQTEQSDPFQFCCEQDLYHPYLVLDYSKAHIQERSHMAAGKDYLKALIAGCDFYVLKDLVVGGSVGYTHGDVISSEGPGHVGSNSFNLAAYFQARFPCRFSLDGAFTWGKNYFDSEKFTAGFVSASYQGYDLASQLRVLYQNALSKLNYLPYISGTYYLQRTGGYTEIRNNADYLNVGKDRFDFLELEFGLNLWVPFSIGCWAIAPQLSVAYLRGFLRDPRNVEAISAVNLNTCPEVQVANITNQQWKLNIGVSTHYLHCLEIFINYEALFDRAYSNYQEYRLGVQRGF